MVTKSSAAICRFGGFGDNMIASSVLPGLRQKYDYVEVISKAPCATVFENNPNIDRLVIKDEVDIPCDNIDRYQDWHRARAKEYTLYRHVSHSVEMRHAAFYGQPSFLWSDIARRKMYGGSYIETIADITGPRSQAERDAGVTPVPYSTLRPGFFPTGEELDRAQRDKAEKIGNGRDGPVIGWAVSGSRIDKRHPRAGYAIARIIKELGATVALFGWLRDLKLVEEIEGQVKHFCGETYGKIPGLVTCISRSEKDDTWPVRRGFTQLQTCDLVVTPDSAPWWVVHSESMPKVLMVSHASAENIGKYGVNTIVLAADPARVPCHPCHKLHNEHSTCVPNADNDGAACISDISVETIVCAVADALSKEVMQHGRRARDNAEPPPLSGGHPSLVEWRAAAE